MEKILEIKQVSKSFGKKKIIDNVSFSVNGGEVFGFLGPNGAGKTTVIKMICGLLSIDSGEIIVNGHGVSDEFEKAMARVGGIIENPELYGYLSGRENLKLFSRMHAGIDESRINEMVELVKLGNRIDDKVKKYSLGMRQRLGVAQALIHKPNLLILDEPTNGLDPMGIKELRDILHTLTREQGVAVLVSSHLLSEMELMCDRVGIIDAGRMIDIKTIDEIRQSETQQATYRFEVSDLALALKLAAELYPGVETQAEEQALQIPSDREKAALFNRTLVQAGVCVYGFEQLTHSLEDEFLRITTGSKSQIR